MGFYSKQMYISMKDKYFPNRMTGDILDAMSKGEDGEGVRQQLRNQLKDNGLDEKLADPEYCCRHAADLERYDAEGAWQRVAGQLRPRRSLGAVIARYASAAVVFAGVIILTVIGGKIDDPYHAGEDAQVDATRQMHMKAVLDMGDNKVVNLQDASAAARAGATLLRKGVLAYGNKPGDGPVAEHTLSVPRGGEYTLVLPDGTTVILNADSKLVYPNRFTGAERNVELTGEAYFKVVKDPSKPFIVRTGNISIRVLGTSFNVRAYEGESVQTTLVEGSVLITTDSEHIKIRPGEQLVIKSDTLSIRQIDVKTVFLGNRDNRFVFDDEPLADVMRKLERWYDFEFVVADESLHHIRFTGNLPKYQNLSKALHMLELTTCVKFGMAGNVLTVERDL